MLRLEDIDESQVKFYPDENNKLSHKISLGRMNWTCKYCKALLFDCEYRSGRVTPCCSNGRISIKEAPRRANLQGLTDLINPPFIKENDSTADKERKMKQQAMSRVFLENVNEIQRLLCIATPNLDQLPLTKQLNREIRGGIKSIKIIGQYYYGMCLKVKDLEDKANLYLPGFFIDDNLQLENVHKKLNIDDPNIREVLEICIENLRKTTLVQRYQTNYDIAHKKNLTRENGDTITYVVVLTDRNCPKQGHGGQYEFLYNCNDHNADEFCYEKEGISYVRGINKFRKSALPDYTAISTEDDTMYKVDPDFVYLDSMLFNLLWPEGGSGWHEGIVKYVENSSESEEKVVDSYNTSDFEDLSNDAQYVPKKKKKRRNRIYAKRTNITRLEFYRYKCYIRNEEKQIRIKGTANYMNVNNDRFMMGTLWETIILTWWNRILLSRLKWYDEHQEDIRNLTIQSIIDNKDVKDKKTKKPMGKESTVLPASFSYSWRAYNKAQLDALAVISALEMPDLFLTVVANSKWKEIQDNLPFLDPLNPENYDTNGNLKKAQTSTGRPELVERVFKEKLRKLENLIMKERIFGEAANLCYSIEWQKRGLPHAHMIITLVSRDKPRTIEDINRLMCAQIPDKETQPLLYELVKQYQIHGPCFKRCKRKKDKDGNMRCTKNYPHKYRSNTVFIDKDYPELARPSPEDGGNMIPYSEKPHSGWRRNITNQDIVPYSPLLLLAWDGHHNLEYIRSLRTVSYLFKYAFKGESKTLYRLKQDAKPELKQKKQQRIDRYNQIRKDKNLPVQTDGELLEKNGIIEEEDPNDEVQAMRDAYICCSTQGANGIIGGKIRRNTTPVEVLEIHLKQDYSVRIDMKQKYTDETVAKLIENSSHTRLQAYFDRVSFEENFPLEDKELITREGVFLPRAGELKYEEFPRYYVVQIVNSQKVWKRRSPNSRFFRVARMWNIYWEFF